MNKRKIRFAAKFREMKVVGEFTTKQREPFEIYMSDIK